MTEPETKFETRFESKLQPPKTRLALYTNQQALIQFQVQNPGFQKPINLRFHIPEETIIQSIVANACDLQTRCLAPLSFATPMKTRLNMDTLQDTMKNQWLGKPVKVVDDFGNNMSGILMHLTQENCLLFDPVSKTTIYIRNFRNLQSDSNSTESEHNSDQMEFLQQFQQNFIDIFVPNPDLNPIEVSYLTEGFEWVATYRFVLNREANHIVTGTADITLLNRTHVELNDVCTELILGEVNTREDSIDRRSSSSASMEMFQRKALAGSAQEESVDYDQQVSQYMRIPLPSNITLPPFQRIDVHLIKFQEYPIVPYYIYDLTQNSDFQERSGGGSSSLNRASWGIELRSRKHPFPPGNVTVYQQQFACQGQSVESSQSPQDHVMSNEHMNQDCQSMSLTGTYVGAARILKPMQPKKDKVRLMLGKSEELIGKHLITLEDLAIRQYGAKEGEDLLVDIRANLLVGRIYCKSKVYLRYELPLRNAKVNVEQLIIQSTSGEVEIRPHKRVKDDELLFCLDGLQHQDRIEVNIKVHVYASEQQPSLIL